MMPPDSRVTHGWGASEIQRERKPSLTKRAKRMTTKPAATHCVLVTAVCWYASSVTAVPTHPIRNPLRFRSMPSTPTPLLASCPRCQLLSGFSPFLGAVACGDETKDSGAGDGELKQKSQRPRCW
ncbi:hypothetical protein Zm00014a_028577 [Zea mays]|uniref:Uncharacterized protein n=1 Tax=Zea mays TaxID=4577 RepID=A0A3L6G6N9_MAIZE|nr:hypothetical protein Zm00014a_028577 [Zea mays]